MANSIFTYKSFQALIMEEMNTETGLSDKVPR